MHDIVRINYIRPNIVDELRGAATGKRLNKAQRKLFFDAASEITELREFCEKNGKVIARLMAEMARSA